MWDKTDTEKEGYENTEINLEMFHLVDQASVRHTQSRGISYSCR